MKRILIILLLMVTTAVVAFTAAEAGRKQDNRPDGGSLGYGSTAGPRPSTLSRATR